MLKVVEIFSSVEGEGIRQGYPCTFIRLYGCNLHCNYCDSQYACTGNSYVEMTEEEIFDKVKWFGNDRVTITGGEPLTQDIKRLVELLNVEYGCYEVNIETNGSIDISKLDYSDLFDVITMDWKCLGSGDGAAKMIPSNISLLGQDDVLKFVVKDEKDLVEMVSVINTMKPICHIFVSPVFGEIDPQDIVKFMLEHHLNNVRMQLQIHKFIWDKDKRGV